MQTLEKKTVIKAINELGRRVTAADVASKTGLPILVATAELNKIAAETEGHLEVATTGDVAYKFSPAFQAAYLAQGFKKVLLDFGTKAFDVGYFLLRISFGVMLIVSFILIVIMIFAVILYLNKGNDRDSGDHFGGFHFGFFDYLILRDLLFWGTYSSSRSGRYPAGNQYHNKYLKEKPKGNFLFDCFSFLFGDGNPNADIEERKWQMIARVIKSNNGVVTAEQLAPFTGADPTNEDGVLPVLVRFDGKPEVTEKGNIVYLFPSLQVSAAGTDREDLPQCLAEYRWTFTGPQTGSLLPVYLLAGFNFFGSWWLVAHLPALVMISPLIAILAVALAVYGTMFVTVPFLRWLALIMINKGIEARNRKRRALAEPLRNPQPVLIEKLGEAKSLSIKERKLDERDVVYTTERDALEQEFDAR